MTTPASTQRAIQKSKRFLIMYATPVEGIGTWRPRLERKL